LAPNWATHRRAEEPDWVLLADLIEYEMAPLLKKLDAVYTQV
jgi:hypothetical protein